MKASKITAAIALMLIGSVSAFAGNSNERETDIRPSLITTPAMNWGNPEDVSAESVRSLDNSVILPAPEMTWGHPNDVAAESVKSLEMTLAVPEMTWGNPEDVKEISVEQLKNLLLFTYPKMEWGNVNDVQSVTVSGLIR